MTWLLREQRTVSISAYSHGQDKREWSTDIAFAHQFATESAPEVEPQCGFTSRAASSSSINTPTPAMDFSSFSNELPAPNSRTARHQLGVEIRCTVEEHRSPEMKQPDDPKRFTTTLNSRTASSPSATTETVVTAYSRPQREKLMYEVSVIVGTDRKPIGTLWKLPHRVWLSWLHRTSTVATSP